jgi:hypothetical protein
LAVAVEVAQSAPVYVAEAETALLRAQRVASDSEFRALLAQDELSNSQERVAEVMRVLAHTHTPHLNVTLSFILSHLGISAG